MTTDLHLVPNLRMCGGTMPLPQYIFMTWRLIKQEIRLHGVMIS